MAGWISVLIKVSKLKAGAKITLLGTAEGGELKAPGEKVVTRVCFASSPTLVDESLPVLPHRQQQSTYSNSSVFNYFGDASGGYSIIYMGGYGVV